MGASADSPYAGLVLVASSLAGCPVRNNPYATVLNSATSTIAATFRFVFMIRFVRVPYVSIWHNRLGLSSLPTFGQLAEFNRTLWVQLKRQRNSTINKNAPGMTGGVFGYRISIFEFRSFYR